jgi:hypothetical protein
VLAHFGVGKRPSGYWGGMAEFSIGSAEDALALERLEAAGRSGQRYSAGEGESILTRGNIEKNRDKLPKFSIAYHGSPYRFD